jgi:M6 family metalloprotease-like protein
MAPFNLSKPRHPENYRLLPVLVVVFLLWAGFSFALENEDMNQLHRLRETRRAASMQLQSNKSALDSPAAFGLLVIPVDFSDARLPSTWNSQDVLQSSMFGHEGQTMENYFRIASDGRMSLEITVAPLIHLSGSREEYSDIGWAGFSRTRALATEAISSVARQGLEFRRLDMDGPDGIPGSDDDDGQVDGVLILHSGPGQENDTTDGLIQPLQFFIEPPVESGGVQASFYAVASLQSGLGVWAHETGHLLGMEDRYDPLLHPEAGGVDVRSLGGLGRFSLMSSGAWGTGGGNQPALPDAYSCWQLGWTNVQRYPLAGNPLCNVTSWRQGGEPPVKVWSAGLITSEYFLMETRDPEATFPFDAGLPQGQMLVYHVDESVPDGWYVSDGGSDYHLRVRLVEADHDSALENGEDDGRDEDSFPGPLGVNALTSQTSPNSYGYFGPSGVSLETITSQGSFVTCRVSDSPTVHSLTLSFQVVTDDECYLDLNLLSLAEPMNELLCSLSIWGDGGGFFPGGSTSVDFSLTGLDGIWTPNEDLAFVAPINPAPGAVTQFNFQFFADGQELPAETRPWVWISDQTTFDFNDPDWIFWQEEFPNLETNTRWHLWDQAPYLTSDGSSVLACTGENFSSSGSWPEVQYGRAGRAALISPPLGEDIRGVQLTHAIEVEYLHAGTVMDGATVFWQGPDGSLVSVQPVDGWDAVISDESDNTLGSSPVFADSMLILDDANIPQWRCDVLPLPSTGQGPWRLRLEFSSNYLWRWRGWFVAKMDPMTFVPDSAFPISWNPRPGDCPAGLSWEAPFPTGNYSHPVVEFFDPGTNSFKAIEHQETRMIQCGSGYTLPKEFILEQLQPSGLTRHLLRVLSTGSQGVVASRSVVVYPDEGAQPVGYLEQPFPNPSTGSIKFLVEVPPTEEAVLKIYDLRGRLVHSKDCAAGRYQVFWDGLDDRNRRLAAGTYYLKLEGSGFSSMRKVVLIR